MKNLLLICALLLICLGAYADPLSESFTDTNFPPNGWICAQHTWYRENDPNYCHTLPGAARCGYVMDTYWLITPRLTPVPGANILSFWYRDHESSPIFDYNDEYTYVMVTAQSNNYLHFTDVVWTGGYQDFTMGWQQAQIDLSAYNYQNIYIGFKHVATGGNFRYFDDISGLNTAVIAPDDPTGFFATPAGDNQINLSWTNNAANDRVMVAFNTSDSFGQPQDGQNYSVGSVLSGGATVIYNEVGSFYQHQGLVSGTNYHYKAWSVQELAEEIYYSIGVTSSTSTTGAIGSYPWLEGFEVGNTHNAAVFGWTQEGVSGSQVWTANNAYTNYNRSPRTGSWNAFLRYGNNRWLFRDLLLTGGTQYNVELWARQDGYSASYANITIAYGSTASAAGMLNTILPATGISNGAYQCLSGSFTPPTDGVYYLGIKGYISSTPWYISLDDISVTAVPPVSLDPPQPTISLGSSPDTIRLDWDPIPGADWYAVYASEDPEADYGPGFDVPLQVPYTNFCELPAALSKHFFKITAGEGLPPVLSP